MSKNRIYTLLLSAVLLAGLASCKQPQTRAQGETALPVTYAEGFSLSRTDQYTRIEIRNPWDTARVLHTYITVPKDRPVPEDLPQGTLLRTPLENTLVYSSIHCSLLEQLGMLHRIGGVCDLSYINLASIQSLHREGKVIDMGNSMSPDIEKIIDNKPEAILLSPFENMGYGRIEKLNIPLVECADYLETSPLGRAEWMRVFGILYGCEQQADSLFRQIARRYDSLKNEIAATQERPVVISETKLGATWYMPGGKSYMAQLFRDAGAAYPWSDNEDTGSIPLAFEVVLEKAQHADFWLIKYFADSDKNYASLADEYAPYQRFDAFRDRHIYGCNTSRKLYYEETPFQPDRLLQELAYIFHPETVRQLYPGYQPRYFNPLSE